MSDPGPFDDWTDLPTHEDGTDCNAGHIASLRFMASGKPYWCTEHQKNLRIAGSAGADPERDDDVTRTFKTTDDLIRDLLRDHSREELMSVLLAALRDDEARAQGRPSLDVDWEQVAHDMHRHFWPGSVARQHGDPNMGDCYKCRKMGDWLRARLRVAGFAATDLDEAFQRGYRLGLGHGWEGEPSLDVDSTLDRLAVWAVRYTLGRMTYAVHDVVETLLFAAPRLRSITRERIVIDIDRALEENRCGMDFDCDAWRQLRARLAPANSSGSALPRGGVSGARNTGPDFDPASSVDRDE